ncbi:hypothetical protein SAMN05421740_110131 [Parapedobacter koreensis]|uniref:Uncharacterized protein n=1 Tax=Parapedobacter koreensis TaxID=332977 RepID=A0A1H7T713_9SPHI|nr:hypothetical protein SAMN05421740_110131 [Parapedobacter koreensis]
MEIKRTFAVSKNKQISYEFYRKKIPQCYR